MAGSCRFAFAVHLLAVLACKRSGAVTSTQIARSVNTNPVVIRRLLASLRRAGLITTHHGAGAGSHLAVSPGAIALDSVYRAVREPATFSLHPQKPNRCCPVGKKIERVLEEVFSSAQTALEEALARRTLADVLETMGGSPRRTTRRPQARTRKAT